MKKYLPAVLFSTFVFILIIISPIKIKLSEDKYILTINVKASETDDLQLFYKSNNEDFSEQKSFYNKIIGSPDIQKVEFVFPSIENVNVIRLDLGQNQNQKRINIESINWCGTEISTDNFEINEYIIMVNSPEFLLKIRPELSPAYDPFIVLKRDLQSIELTQKKDFSKIILALLVSIVFFFSINKKIQTYQKATESAYILMFLIVLTFPYMYELFADNAIVKNNENRELAKKPEFKLSPDYAGKFESYYNDNFGYRNETIELASKFKVDFLHVSPKPDMVLFGDKSFLFYNDPITIESYSNSNVLSGEQLENIFKSQLEIKQKLESNSKKYILGYIPNKHTIYSEFLPYSMKVQKKNNISLANQLKDYFSSKDFPFIDITDQMLNEKKYKQLYYKHDTHWNYHGAYVGYKAFCDATMPQLGLIPFSLDHFDIRYHETGSGDLTKIMGVSGLNSNQELVPTYTFKNVNYASFTTNDGGQDYPAQTIITLNENALDDSIVMVFCDSFSTLFRQFLSLHYKRVIYIWSYPVDSHPIEWYSLIEKENPDIVINLCVERFLPEMLIRAKY